MDDRRLAALYAPIVHYDVGESIPLQRVGYTVFREAERSDAFPKRIVVPDAGGFVIEYAFFWSSIGCDLYGIGRILRYERRLSGGVLNSV